MFGCAAVVSFNNFDQDRQNTKYYGHGHDASVYLTERFPFVLSALHWPFHKPWLHMGGHAKAQHVAEIALNMTRVSGQGAERRCSCRRYRSFRSALSCSSRRRLARMRSFSRTYSARAAASAPSSTWPGGTASGFSWRGGERAGDQKK